jgi:hypothetical protein
VSAAARVSFRNEAETQDAVASPESPNKRIRLCQDK